MPMYQYLAALYATSPSGGVRFVFFSLYPRVSFALLTPHRGYFFAASPCGEAPDLACLSAGWRFTNGKFGGLAPASRQASEASGIGEPAAKELRQVVERQSRGTPAKRKNNPNPERSERVTARHGGLSRRNFSVDGKT